MYDITTGEYVRGFLASNDLTTAAEISLFDKQGNARTVLAGERLVIGSLAIANGGTASLITIFSDPNAGSTVDTGESLYAASLAANTSANPHFVAPLIGIRSASIGVKTMAIASAASASTRISLVGILIKS